MTQPSPIIKNLSSGDGDRLIRVLTTTPKNNNFHALTFPESELQGIEEMGQDRSALVLRSGAEIPVALPYEELEQKIYSPNFRTDGPVLDLREVTGEAAKPKAPANANEAPSPGDKMPDDPVYVGISPDTGKKVFAMPADASLTMTFNEAKEYAQGLNTQKAYGYDDWRVPTKAELNVLFNNRAAIGGFVISGSHPAGWYWSASSNLKWLAWGQRFSDGYQNYYLKGNPSSVRCVR
jgi:Protein of unknown function (DUF1566)